MTFHWQLDPTLIGGLLALGICYGLAVGPLRSRLAPHASFPSGQAGLFYLALILVYLTEGSPLHDLAERYSFSGHMLQHNLLSYLAAPLLIRGTPAWVLRPLLLNRYMAPAARILTHPVVAFALFTLFFSLWHIPVIYEGALHNSALHHFEHVLFLVTSFFMWWPILSPLPELPRLHHSLQLLYLFVLPLAQLPVFGAVTFSDHLLYPTYAAASSVTPWDPHHDQALGGVLMKLAGMFAFGIPFVTAFYRWFTEEDQTVVRRKAVQAP